MSVTAYMFVLCALIIIILCVRGVKQYIPLETLSEF